MQLDRTTIAIRERDLTDILDLALHLLHKFFWPLMLTGALGVIPLMLINHLLIGWMADVDYREEFPLRYIWNLSILVFLEAPLAMAFATQYLGQAVFLERPRTRDVVRDVMSTSAQLIWYQLVLRGVAAAWLLLLLVDRQGTFDPFLEGFLLPGIVFYAALLRALRPFMNELILLERNPMRSQDRNKMTISRRSNMLHARSGGDLFGRAIGVAVVIALLVLALYGGILFMSGIFFNDWEPGPLLIQIALPISMWVAAVYSNLVRFLIYLDTRIRHEGWEVELRLRAEAARWKAGLKGGWA